MKKRIISCVIIFATLLSFLSSTIEINVVSASSGVASKIQTIAVNYPHNSYFSVNGEACNGSSDNHFCYNCCLTNIDADSGKVCGVGYSCWAFANYVFYQTFGIAPSHSNNTYEYCAAGNINTYAKFGDYVECYDANGNTVHYFIYLGGSGYVNCYKYESNVGTPNKISYNQNTTVKKYSSFKIIHAYNYDSVNSVVSKPTKPENVILSAKENVINVSWSPVAGATSYVVYVYSKSNCSEVAYKAIVESTSISNIILEPGRYWVYIHAANSAGAGSASGPYNYLTGPCNLNVNRDGNTLILNWDEVPGANCYDIIMKKPNGESTWLHSSVNSKIITNCKPGTYEFEVQSLYRNNESITGQIVGAHSRSVSYSYELTKPENLRVDNTNNLLNIYWDVVDGATCYDIIIQKPDGCIEYLHSHDNSKTIVGYGYGLYKIEVQALYRESESKEGQVVGPHSETLMYDYQVFIDGGAKEDAVNVWICDNNGWCYIDAFGAKLTNNWVQDSVGWCYVGADGYMVTNQWIMDSVGWCYVGADGYCVTDCWMKDSIGWCYLDSEGRMATNQWILDSVGWCYVGADGYCVTNSWMQDSIGWCYLDADGRMVYNTYIRDSKGLCYIDSNGYWNGKYL